MIGEFHFTFYEAALFGILFVAFTFILLLIFTGKKNRAANRYLAMAMVVAVLGVTGLLPFGSRLPIQFSMAFGPFLFL